MKMLILVTLFAMGAGCTAETLKHVNRIGLFAAETSIACDWGQTRSAASTGWKSTYEGNAIMGPSPSTRTVDVYMASAAAVTALAWYVAPDYVRPFIATAVTTVEANTIAGNLRTTQGLCGVSGGPARDRM